MNHDDPTYHAHMVSVTSGDNDVHYHISCSCSWYTFLASRSDVVAAQLALEHVKEAHPAAIFRRTGTLTNDPTQAPAWKRPENQPTSGHRYRGGSPKEED